MNNKHKKRLLENTIFLYALTFSGYFFSLITVPYQTRILGPEFYGKVGFAVAMMTYFRLVIDFGFILSATADVAKNREDAQKVASIYTAVMYAKGLLTALSFVVLLGICYAVPMLRQDMFLYLLTFASVAVSAFLPDFLYRGLETMKRITIRTLIIQAFFVLMIFLFLKTPQHYYFVPLFTLIGNAVALLFVQRHVSRQLKIKFVRLEKGYLWQTIQKSSPFFFSRISATIYQVTNTLFLGLMYSPGSAKVGMYVASDRLIGTAKTTFSPLADSLYPYMVKNRDFRLLKKIIWIIMPPVIIICIVLSIYANECMALFLGPAFYGAGSILRLLLPIVAITPLVYMLGFPTLSPMGLARHANLSTVVSAVVQLVGLSILFLTGTFSVQTLCMMTVLSQFTVLVYRVFIVWKNRHIFSQKELLEDVPQV
ncbi:oligosaccharide flippase family protein [Listeria booriae]|uniref:Oligosaccharide flippase family protein n=1 Tax=Listeria booriae TaxID=1552123 RepID=A0A7X1CZ45_9LIST|nr:oligosaccharide flippase family protein [Listeria booriae]MBC2105737.1 oligosaccharide flippase family protein [Listeria booriae]MBC2117083.1 oligosaccharide flippase family protein [Listeria booriae]